MKSRESMDKVFGGVIAVILVIIARFAFIPEASPWGPVVTFGAALAFFGVCLRVINSMPERIPPSDPAGPDQGWDPEVVKAARRRADGIE